MNNYLLAKESKSILKEYIFIFLTATIFLFFSLTKSSSEENVFTIDSVKVKGAVDLNFSREKYFNKAFIKSFEILSNKILLTRDSLKIRDTELKEIKKLIRSFQVLEESYKSDVYSTKLKVFYSEKKIKNFLRQKNISFSQPEKITTVFYPVLFINDKIVSFNENYFYNHWNEVKIKNETINFVLPLEDLDDVSKISKNKDQLEKLDIKSLVNKYDQENFVFTLMNYENKELNIFLKTNFNKNIMSKNITYKVKNINDNLILNKILKDLKLNIIDLWKEQNVINLLMPLSINVKYQQQKIEDLDYLKSIFKKISIIDSHNLKEFNINSSYFKIYYYGNPKKLQTELFKYGYSLKEDKGIWQLYLNE